MRDNYFPEDEGNRSSFSQSSNDLYDDRRENGGNGRMMNRGNFQNRGEAKEKVRLGQNRPSRRSQNNWVPYLLLGLAIFFGICFIMNLFCNWGNKLEATPAEHWMGYIGYYVCYGLFGLFGSAAFLIPILLGVLGAFWKNFTRDGIEVEKSVASALLLLTLSNVIHVFYLAILPAQNRYILPKALIHAGAKMVGGGFIGGEMGYFFIRYFSVAGAIITSGFLFLLVIFFFLGMTPNHLFSYLRNRKDLRAGRRSIPDVKEMENAWKEMSKKHLAAQNPSRTLAEDCTNSALPPAGAVRSEAALNEEKALERQTRSSAAKPANKEDGEDGLAPMPMPTLNTFDDSGKIDTEDGSLFIPEGFGDLQKGFAPSRGKSLTEKALAMEAEYYKGKKKNVSESLQKQAEEVEIEEKLQEEDRADWIFPRNNDVKTEKVQKEDRDFELDKIFIELDDLDTNESRNKHSELPPEVPMKFNLDKDVKNSKDEWIFAKSEVRKPMDVWMGVSPTETVSPSVKDEFEPEEAEEEVETERQVQRSFAPPEMETLHHREEHYSAPMQSSKDLIFEEEEEPEQPHYVAKDYQFPSTAILHPAVPITEENQSEIRDNIQKLQTVLNDFRIGVSNITYSYGPTITRYEIFPAPGVRVRTVVNLADDISLCFARSGVRMEAPIPGMSAIGVEVPNDLRCTVYLRELLESEKFQNSKSKLTAGLGVDVTGKPILFDIAKMPHLLVAGATGMGKSVCINCIILSLLYRAKPEEVKLILIDPKKVEFSLYKAIPHLMAPIVTSPKDATGALQAAVEEMERRFELIEEVGVHDLEGYNEATKNDPDMPFLPQIVIIIDELADLMMTARDEVETAICRLAQKARAAGMHIIVGTQRPSVDVVTGLIKSNIPSRIACTVASQVDSRTILDVGGAEKLIGKGDMLFAPVGCMKPARVQGAFVDVKEVESICNFIRSANGTAVYDERFTKKMKEFSSQCGNKGKTDASDFASGDGSDGEIDPKYMDALRIAVEENRVATSLLQRKLGVGYSRAAKLIDRMEAEGFVSKPDGTKPRNVLISKEQYFELYMNEGFSSAPKQLQLNLDDENRE